MAKGLREHAYAVDVAADGETACYQAEIADYDAIVLDLLLPKQDGLSVCRQLRQAGAAVPILMLTARDAVESRIEGLDSGADDYLTKPFKVDELRIDQPLCDQAAQPGHDKRRLSSWIHVAPNLTRLNSGLDLSREAIAKAKSIGAVNAEFTVANFEQWQPDRRFDIIVFNESLCYAQRPAEVSLRYADWLTAPGSIIVSLCRYGNHGQIWQNLQAQFAMMTSTRVENNQQQSWDVRIMQRQKNRLEPAL